MIGEIIKFMNNHPGWTLMWRSNKPYGGGDAYREISVSTLRDWANWATYSIYPKYDYNAEIIYLN